MSILQKSLSGIKYVLPYGLVILLKAARAECREFLLKSRGNWFIPQRKFDECIVIANGPSLKKHREGIIRLSKECDVITLNFSIEDDIFFETNSFMHVIADPLFFEFPENDAKYQSFIRFYDIMNALERKLILAVPHVRYVATKNKITNSNITILSYSARQTSSYNDFVRYRMRNGVLGFGCQTVTLASLYLALMARYKKIWVIGFDLSNIYHVDKYCRLVSVVKHFERETRIINSYDYYHEYFLAPESRVHTALLLVKEYAVKNDIQIINLSEESNIDIFPKGNMNGEVFPYKPKGKRPGDEEGWHYI